jgi:hypothetical protein
MLRLGLPVYSRSRISGSWIGDRRRGVPTSDECLQIDGQYPALVEVGPGWSPVGGHDGSRWLEVNAKA